MTKRQVIILVLALLATIVTLAAIPFLQVRSDRSDRAAQAKAGVAFIHHFDCTYGASLRELLASGAYSQSQLASQAFELAEAQKMHHQKEQAAATRKIAEGQLLRAADLLRQYGQIQPLAPGIPCSPRLH